jgi:hypothetical protein
MRRSVLAGMPFALAASPAHALFLSGEALDKAADILAIVVLVLVPVVAIVVFWMLHVLPEKIAEKRHHPQKEAITALCLLSLVFGGLLWPLAWLWTYTKPVGYRLAYGTDKHEDYYDDMALKYRAGKLERKEVIELRQELEEMEDRGGLPPQLQALKHELESERQRTPEKAPA